MADGAPDMTTAPPPGAKRDAIHVAVIPMLALCEMRPGERTANGVVTPGTVTGIRHAWEHPAEVARR